MNRFKKFIKTLFIGLGIGVSTLGITSCASAKEEATSYNFQVVSCVYDSEQDQTRVIWISTLTNDSIYNITSESFKFDLYQGSSFVRTTNYYHWTIEIKHGASNTGSRYFYVEGNITNVELHSWVAHFDNLWNTYKAWFIAAIVITSLCVLAYVIAMIVIDFDLSDVFEFFEDHLYFLPILIVAFIPYLISGLSSGVWSWVPPIIIGSGLAIIIVAILISHLIKYILVDVLCLDAIGMSLPDNTIKIKKRYDSKGEPFLEVEDDGKRYYINDVADDREALRYFSIKDLKTFCEKHKWKEAESLNSKVKLAILIEDKHLEKGKKSKEENSEGNKKTTKSKKYSKTRFDDIAGLEEAKKAFKEKVILPFLHPEIYKKFGKKVGGGILLYGLPGTGKTMFAEAAANEIDALFIPIKCSDIKSKWYGESEKNVKDIFAKARKAEKAIIFFDEFEAIGAKRTDSENANNDLVPQILAEMQGVGSSSNKSVIIVIAATNKPWAIDSAFMRPGRFDEKIYIPLPDFEARKKLFELQLKKLPIADDLDFDYLAKITEGFNGADIKEVCEKLKMSAINDSLEKGEEQTIGMDDVQKVEKDIKSSVSKEDIIKLQKFEQDSL